VTSDWVQLAERVKAGDRSAFRTLVDRTHVVAYRLALRTLGDVAEAEDVLQDAYLRAWMRREALRDPAAAPAWIYGIVRNVASTRARSRFRRGAREVIGDPAQLQQLATFLADLPSPEQQAGLSRLGEVVMQVIGQLREKHRVVLLLRAVDGMSYDELSEMLGVPVGTVESRLHRARQHLAKKLRALGVESEVCS
jgi:RNA polymerase sigma-70 factor (ECF subfamily)